MCGLNKSGGICHCSFQLSEWEINSNPKLFPVDKLKDLGEIEWTRKFI